MSRWQATSLCLTESGATEGTSTQILNSWKWTRPWIQIGKWNESATITEMNQEKEKNDIHMPIIFLPEKIRWNVYTSAFFDWIKHYSHWFTLIMVYLRVSLYKLGYRYTPRSLLEDHTLWQNRKCRSPI